jgi:hypothetical protein
MSEQQVKVNLRDQEVLVTNVAIAGPDRDVGIMSCYVDNFDLTDTNGNVLDWLLTDQESDIVYMAIWQANEAAT